MNFEPAISCLIEATAELSQRLAHLELLAETELEKARTAKYRGNKESSKDHLLQRRNYEAEANRLRNLLHEIEELIGRFQTVISKHKLLKSPVPPELEILHNPRNDASTPKLDDVDYQLEELKRRIDEL
jgi:hypothetical protein